MILADTSIWIDHFRTTNDRFAALLTEQRIIAHPHVIGEIALGGLKRRTEILRYLNHLPNAVVAAHDEVMTFIDRRSLANSGIGYVDASLLAAAALTPDALLWTRDKKLSAVAKRCGLILLDG